MNDKHPITPPLELVEQWADMLSHRSDHDVFALAVRWGADQELNECCMWIMREKSVLIAEKLGIVRRPEPSSLKEQALAKLAELESDEPGYKNDLEVLRRALEALPE